jgi:hypothetical protein
MPECPAFTAKQSLSLDLEIGDFQMFLTPVCSIEDPRCTQKKQRSLKYSNDTEVQSITDLLTVICVATKIMQVSIQGHCTKPPSSRPTIPHATTYAVIATPASRLTNVCMIYMRLSDNLG